MKKIRMILPAIAIAFAVAGAFVTNASPNSLTDIIVTNDNTTPCSEVGKCVTGGNVTCVSDSPYSALFLESNCPTPVTSNGDFQ